LKKERIQDHRIAISTLKETRFNFTENIVRCELSNNYTTFYLKPGKSCLFQSPFYEYKGMPCNYGFIRCHQPYLGNKRFIRSLIKEDGG